MLLIREKRKVGEPSRPVLPVSPNNPSTVDEDEDEDEVKVDDHAANFNICGRHSRKRKAPFSPGQPAPKIPRVVEYIESSSDGEDAGVGVIEMGVHASLKIQMERFV